MKITNLQRPALGIIRDIYESIRVKDFLFFVACVLLSYLAVMSYDVFLLNDDAVSFIYYLGSIVGTVVSFAIIYFTFLTLVRVFNKRLKNKKYLISYIFLFSILYYCILYFSIIRPVGESDEYYNSGSYHFFPFWKYFFQTFIIIALFQIDIAIVFNRSE
jgi:hypothetical protein